jgi:hypothetical protein
LSTRLSRFLVSLSDNTTQNFPRDRFKLTLYTSLIIATTTHTAYATVKNIAGQAREVVSSKVITPLSAVHSRWPSAHEKTLILPLQSPRVQQTPLLQPEQLSTQSPSNPLPTLQNSSTLIQRAVKHQLLQKQKCDAPSQAIDRTCHLHLSKTMMCIMRKLI